MNGPGLSGATRHFLKSRPWALPADIIRHSDGQTILGAVRWESDDSGRELARAMSDRTGNLPLMPGIYPDYRAPVVRNQPEGRELTSAPGDHRRRGRRALPKRVLADNRQLADDRNRCLADHGCRGRRLASRHIGSERGAREGECRNRGNEKLCHVIPP
jgi:hypothetical protein